MDRGAQWATVHRIAKSWTWLKWLSMFACKTIIWSNNPTTVHIPWRNHNWKRHMYPNVHWSTIQIARMYGCESWTIKKAERWRTDVFKLWCWRRFLRVPWTARRSNQSILEEINSEYSLEGLMLKQKLQYFGHLMQRTDSLEKTLMLERLKARGEGGDRGWDSWMASPTRWTWVWASSRSWWTGNPDVMQSMGSQRAGHNWATELNWSIQFNSKN